MRSTGGAEELASGLVCQAAKQVVEQLLEAEAGELLGPGPRYRRRGERDETPQDAHEGSAATGPATLAGYRNGHKPR